jgi:hypothetical protein
MQGQTLDPEKSQITWTQPNRKEKKLLTKCCKKKIEWRAPQWRALKGKDNVKKN